MEIVGSGSCRSLPDFLDTLSACGVASERKNAQGRAADGVQRVRVPVVYVQDFTADIGQGCRIEFRCEQENASVGESGRDAMAGRRRVEEDTDPA